MEIKISRTFRANIQLENDEIMDLLQDMEKLMRLELGSIWPATKSFVEKLREGIKHG